MLWSIRILVRNKFKNAESLEDMRNSENRAYMLVFFIFWVKLILLNVCLGYGY